MLVAPGCCVTRKSHRPQGVSLRANYVFFDFVLRLLNREVLLYAVPLAAECDRGFSIRSLSAKKIRQSRHLCFRGRSLLTVVRLLDPHSGQ